MIAGAWICLLSPLAGCLAITLAGGRISRRTAGIVATLSVFVAFAGAVVSFVALTGEDAEERAQLTTAWTWLSAGTFDVGFSLLVDPLAAVMMLIVSGVGGLIVWYSIGYMEGDEQERRYFAYMALFVFSMLLLVQAGNFVLLLAGWGLVGLASYLLIGFWHERPQAVAAAKKAFVMNAAGDATMALAFFVLLLQTGTLEFAGAFAGAEGLSSTAVNLVALGLLGGAVAKSAQLPLHTWLPDAMEGPTPVSALIHAATMVTAGVYLIVRAHPIFELAPDVQDLAAGLGAATLLAAGLIALVQTDIKRVIAYSTMSQVGYMFLGAGLGAYGSGMFHLMTHAFFKALLFMGAGLVIHRLAGEQDMRKMGGLRKAMPRTTLAFLIGSLALVGVPPLSGFWSKDAILASALAGGGYGAVLFVAGLAGAFLTGLYTFRMLFLVFWGEPAGLVTEHADGHGHGHGEGPRSMTVPVGILTGLAAVGGLLEVPGLWHVFGDWLHPVAEPLVEPSTGQDYLTSALAVSLGLAGIWVAWILYAARRRTVPQVPFLHRLLEHKLYFDELYDALFYRPAVGLSRFWRGAVEEPLIDGSIAGIALGAQQAGAGVGRAQTGFLRSYLLAIAISAAVLLVVFVSVK